MSQNIEDALSLLAASSEGFLATLEGESPFVSAVSYIYEPDSGAPGKQGKIDLFLSRLARHTKNFQKNPNVSLLVVESSALPIYEKKRVTLQGRIQEVKDEERFRKFKAGYLKIFPNAETFFELPDFQFFEIRIAEIHLIAGFGKITTFR